MKKSMQSILLATTLVLAGSSVAFAKKEEKSQLKKFVKHDKSDRIKYYYCPMTASLTGRIAINELGLKADYEKVDISNHTTETHYNYYDINDKGAVPALLLTNGELLTENAVILQYLADKDSSHKLLPAVGNFERYRVLEMTNYITTDVHKTISAVFIPGLSDANKKEVFSIFKKKLAYLDKKLGNNSYLVGNSFSIADIYLATLLHVSHNYIDMELKEFKNLHRYHDEMIKRPSIAESIKQEEGK